MWINVVFSVLRTFSRTTPSNPSGIAKEIAISGLIPAVSAIGIAIHEARPSSAGGFPPGAILPI